MVLITDGLETCKGDPKADAAALAGNLKLAFGVHVIGFDVNPQDSEALKDIAAAGMGKYYNADSAAELTAAVKNLRTELAQVTPVAAGDDAGLPELTVLVKKRYGNENPLHSEFIVNVRNRSTSSVPTRKSRSANSLHLAGTRSPSRLGRRSRPMIQTD